MNAKNLRALGTRAAAYLYWLAYFIALPMAARVTLLAESLNNPSDSTQTNDRREEQAA